MTNLNLTDMEVCYKVFKREIIQGISLVEERFGQNRRSPPRWPGDRRRIYMPISSYGRSYAEGKKITWKDGFRALYAILKYRFVK